MSPTVLAIVAIVLVAALALWMRRAAGRATDMPITRAPDAPDHDDAASASFAEVLDDDELDEEEALPRHVLVTTEGIALLPSDHAVRLIPLVRDEEAPDWVRQGMGEGVVPSAAFQEALAALTGQTPRGVATGTELGAGDFTAARIRRDAHGQWCVETLGRDGDYGFLPFGAESSAREALEMLERKKVIQRVLDESGEPVPPSSEDFEEARRRYEETERELALAADDDEPAPPGDWSSRR